MSERLDRYYGPISSRICREKPLPGDKHSLRKINEEVDAIESVRRRLYESIMEHLIDYCSGKDINKVGIDLPPVESLRADIPKKTKIGDVRLIIKSRLFAIVNQHIEENSAQIVRKHRESIVEPRKERKEVSTYEVLAPDIVQRVQQSLNVTKKPRSRRAVSAR